MEKQNEKIQELENKIHQLGEKVQQLENIINDMKEDIDYAVYYAQDYYNRYC